MIININSEIVKNFDCLYGEFPYEIAQKMIEQDINKILEMHFDENKYNEPIQISEWISSQLEKI